MMALTYASVGRIAAVVSGHHYKWDASWGKVTGKRFNRFTGEMLEVYEGRGFKTGRFNTGLLTSHITDDAVTELIKEKPNKNKNNCA